MVHSISTDHWLPCYDSFAVILGQSAMAFLNVGSTSHSGHGPSLMAQLGFGPYAAAQDPISRPPPPAAYPAVGLIVGGGAGPATAPVLQGTKVRNYSDNCTK